MDRRSFLKHSVIAGGLSLTPAALLSAGAASPSPIGDKEAGWRHFELVTKVALEPGRGRSRIWLPIPMHGWLEHQRPVDNRFSGNYSRVGIFREPVYDCEALYAQWDDEPKGPMQI